MATSIWAGYPRSYTPGRSRPVQFVTLHYTAGSEGPTSAEAGVAYDKVRTDGTSAHYYTDSQGLALQEVPDGDRAHTALYHGNQIGIHIEICGTRQTRAQWLDPVSLATLQTTAALVRDLCLRHGLPMVRLSTAQTRAAWYAASGSRPKGINDHNACTLAFPEDGGSHTDVGPEFPWDVFMQLVSNGGDMTVSDPNFQALIYRVEALIANRPTVAGGPTAGEVNQLHNKLAEIDAKIEALAVGTGLDPAALEILVREAVRGELDATKLGPA